MFANCLKTAGSAVYNFSFKEQRIARAERTDCRICAVPQMIEKLDGSVVQLGILCSSVLIARQSAQSV